jgi:hypothetical protein
MRILETTAAMLLAGVVMFASTSAHAYGNGTPDEQPPAQEQQCESAGLYGSAFGLCVAFCEANDCDAQLDQPDDRACSTLRKNYIRATGQLFFPCEIDRSNEE